MKILYLLVFVTIELFASTMNEAISFYKNENYIQAYERFYLLHIENKQDKEATLYLAKSLYSLGEYKRAEFFLYSLYKSDKENDEVRFYLAKVLYEERHYIKAKELFDESINTQYGKKSKEYIVKIDEITALHKYFFLFSLGMQYDDNIRNNTFETETTHGSIVLSNDTDKVSDTFIEKMLYATHKYKLPKHGALRWEDTLLLYHRNGLKHADQNMLYSSLSSGLNIHKNGLVLKPKILLNDLFYASRHYMYSYGIGLKVIKNLLSNNLQLGINVAVRKEKFVHDEDKTKDDTNSLCEIKLLHKLTENDSFQYIATFQKFRKEFGNRVDISRDRQTYGLQYTRKLPLNSTVTLQTKYENSKFIEDDVSFGERKDTRQFYIGSFSKQFQKVYSISCKYNYTKNISTISAYSYKKSTVSLMLSRYF